MVKDRLSRPQKASTTRMPDWLRYLLISSRIISPGSFGLPAGSARMYTGVPFSKTGIHPWLSWEWPSYTCSGWYGYKDTSLSGTLPCSRMPHGKIILAGHPCT